MSGIIRKAQVRVLPSTLKITILIRSTSPIQFRKDRSINEIQQALAAAILK